MKILIVSDAHSNIDALEAVWKKESDSDAVLFAGDALDYGFFPCEVIDWLKCRKALAVKGNHERELIEKIKNYKFIPAELSERFDGIQLAKLRDTDWEYINNLPETLQAEFDGIDYLMMHQLDYEDKLEFLPQLCYTEYNSINGFNKIWNEKAIKPSLNNKRRIVYGHTHQIWAGMPRAGMMWLNPGSVSYRLGADSVSKGADYLTVVDGNPLFHHIDYPSEHLYNMVKESNLKGNEYAVGLSFYGEEK